MAVEKSRSQIMEAVDLRPEVVLLEKDGQITEIPAEEAKAGDIVQVRPGDRIPLDGVVIEGESRIGYFRSYRRAGAGSSPRGF